MAKTKTKAKDGITTTIEYGGKSVTYEEGELELLTKLLGRAVNYSLDKVVPRRYTKPETGETETRMVITISKPVDDRVSGLFKLRDRDDSLDYEKGVPLDIEEMGYHGLLDVGIWEPNQTIGILLTTGYLTEAKIKGLFIELKISVVEFTWPTFGKLWDMVAGEILIGIFNPAVQEKMDFEGDED